MQHWAHLHGCWVSPKVFSHSDLLLAEHQWDPSCIMAVDHGVQKPFTISSWQVNCHTPVLLYSYDFYVPHTSAAHSQTVALFRFCINSVHYKIYSTNSKTWCYRYQPLREKGLRRGRMFARAQTTYSHLDCQHSYGLSVVLLYQHNSPQNGQCLKMYFGAKFPHIPLF